MNTLTLNIKDNQLFILVKDFLENYKGIEVVEESDSELETYLIKIKENATEYNTISHAEMRDKFFAKICELDTQRKQNNL